MGFVLGGGDIAISTELPPSSFVYRTSNSTWNFYTVFYVLASGFGFGMYRLTLARGVIFLLSSEYSGVMCRARPGTIVTWPWLRLSMIYCCALKLFSQLCATCRSCWFLDSVALSCCAGERYIWHEGWLHTYKMVTEHFANPNLGWQNMYSVCAWEKYRKYLFSVYRNSDLDDRIFDCLLT